MYPKKRQMKQNLKIIIITIISYLITFFYNITLKEDFNE